jgi:hypothetical protein
MSSLLEEEAIHRREERLADAAETWLIAEEEGASLVSRHIT